MGLKGKKLPMPTREKLCELYLIANKTPFEIGQNFKVSANTVRRWLKQYDVAVKRPYTSYVKANLSSIECAYLAGYLDGDGSINIGVGKNKRSKRGLNPHYEVSFVSKDEDIIRTLKKVVGGNIASFIYHDSREQKECYKLAFCNQASALALLEQIEPFLILKKQQAKLMIMFLRERLKARRLKGNYAPISEFCWKIVYEIRRLNS